MFFSQMAFTTSINRSLMIATGLFVGLLSTNSYAYTAEQQQLCTGDAMRLCSAEIPDEGRGHRLHDPPAGVAKRRLQIGVPHGGCRERAAAARELQAVGGQSIEADQPDAAIQAWLSDCRHHLM